MVTERGMRVRIGLFVLAALVLLGILVLLFGSYPTFFKRHEEITVVFAEASGLGPGAPVRRSGVRVGQVKDMTLNDETGQVEVRLQIEKPYHVRRNEQPTIVTSLLGGDSAIEFIPKREDPKNPLDHSPVEPTDPPLVGVRSVSINTLLTQASDVVPITQEAIADIRDSLKKVDKEIDTLGPLAEDALKEYRGLAKDARTEIGKVDKTNDEIQTAARSWGKLGERLDLLLQTNQDKIVKSVDNMNEVLARMAAVLSEENQRYFNDTLKNLKTSSDRLPNLTKNADETMKKTDELITNLNTTTKPFAERAPSLAKNLDETTDKLNKVLGDARELIKALGEGDGTFRRLITDPSLYNHLDDAACQLTRILPRVDRILKDAEVFADKIARHPELIGAGGIIRGSSGLKEPPSEPAPATSFKPHH
jgi:phospholipid/cholesterol/gamma-HCH transport system substrate-binding protein